MVKLKMKKVEVIGGIAIFIFVVVMPIVLGIIKFLDHRNTKIKTIQEQKLIYESLSSRMSKELGLVRNDYKYYMELSKIDEKLSKKEMTVKELSKINIEMQELLRNKELLMKNKKNVEEAQKIYQQLKNFTFEENILLEKEKFENFDRLLYETENFLELLEEYYKRNESFDFRVRKEYFNVRYKEWTGEQLIIYKEFPEKAFSVFREERDRALKEMCSLWEVNEPYIKKENKGNDRNIVFKEKTFVFRPDEDAQDIPEERIHSFLCGKQKQMIN